MKTICFCYITSVTLYLCGTFANVPCGTFADVPDRYRITDVIAKTNQLTTNCVHILWDIMEALFKESLVVYSYHIAVK